MVARVLVALALLLALVWTSTDAPSFSADSRRVACYDSAGQRVDWWIVYKNAGDGQFVELTSLDVADPNNERLYGTGLSSERSLYSSAFSPMIHTIRMNLSDAYALTEPLASDEDLHEDGADEDNRLFFAWNDEMPQGSLAEESAPGTEETDGESEAEDSEEKPEPRGRSRDARDTRGKSKSRSGARSKSKGPARGSSAKPRAESRQTVAARNLRLGRERDMYGGTVDMRAAHSKGMLGLGFDAAASTVSFYVITHSIPGIPGFDAWVSGDPIKRRQPPEDLEHMFEDRNLMGNTKAQHAMCMSMEQGVSTVDGIIQFSRGSIDHDRDSLFAFLDGLDIIHPGMVMADYDPWAHRHRAYHQLFNVALDWTPHRWDDSTAHKCSNAPLRKGDAMRLAKHAFVLWPTVLPPLRASRKKADSKRAPKLVCRRQPCFFDRNRCSKWDGSHLSSALETSAHFTGRKLPAGHQCFLSITLQTTTVDGDPLEMVVDFKHALMPADLDDIIKRHLVPADARRSTGTVATSPSTAETTHTAYAVVVQSWIDRGTQGPRKYVLSKDAQHSATAWFLNSTHVRLPAEGDSDKRTIVPSSGRDHAKWFASYAYGSGKKHLVIAGVSDLNRNNKATRLSHGDHGRSGAVFVTSNPHIVAFFYEIAGGVEDNARFASLDLGSALANTDGRLAITENDGPTWTKVQFANDSTVSSRIPFFNVVELPPPMALAANVARPAAPHAALPDVAVVPPKSTPKPATTTTTAHKPAPTTTTKAPFAPAKKPTAASTKPLATGAVAPATLAKKETLTKALAPTSRGVTSGAAPAKIPVPVKTVRAKIPVHRRVPKPADEARTDDEYALMMERALELVKDVPLPNVDDLDIVTTYPMTATRAPLPTQPLCMVRQPMGAFTYRESAAGVAEVDLERVHDEL